MATLTNGIALAKRSLCRVKTSHFESVGLAKDGLMRYNPQAKAKPGELVVAVSRRRKFIGYYLPQLAGVAWFVTATKIIQADQYQILGVITRLSKMLPFLFSFAALL